MNEQDLSFEKEDTAGTVWLQDVEPTLTQTQGRSAPNSWMITPAAQPAPGRWHWWVTPDIIYPCCCTDAKHFYAAPEPEYLNALEAERDALRELAGRAVDALEAWSIVGEQIDYAAELRAALDAAQKAHEPA